MNKKKTNKLFLSQVVQTLSYKMSRELLFVLYSGHKTEFYSYVTMHCCFWPTKLLFLALLVLARLTWKTQIKECRKQKYIIILIGAQEQKTELNV